MYNKSNDTQVANANVQTVNDQPVFREKFPAVNGSITNAPRPVLTKEKKKHSRFSENDTVLFATEICCGEVLEIVKECIEANADLVLTDIAMTVAEMSELAKDRLCNIIVAGADIWGDLYAALNQDDRTAPGIKALLIEDGELKESRFYWVAKSLSRNRSNDIFAAYRKAPAIRNGLAEDAYGRRMTETKPSAHLDTDREVHFVDESMTAEAVAELISEKGISEIATTAEYWLTLSQALNRQPGNTKSLTVHLFLNEETSEERFYWIPAALSAGDLHDPYAAYQLAPAVRRQKNRRMAL